VTNTSIIAALKGIPIIVMKAPGYIVGVAIFITVIYIRRAMVLEILSRPFQAIVKSPPLNLVKF